jgi:hypothetical protein
MQVSGCYYFCQETNLRLSRLTERLGRCRVDGKWYRKWWLSLGMVLRRLNERVRESDNYEENTSEFPTTLAKESIHRALSGRQQN